MLRLRRHSQPALLESVLVRNEQSVKIWLLKPLVKPSVLANEAREKTKLWFLVPLLIVVVYLTALPSAYQVGQGKMSVQLTPGVGGVDIPLGPFGEINKQYYKTPFNIRLNLLLDRSIADGRSAIEIASASIKEFELDAKSILYPYLAKLLVLLLLIGAIVGAIIGGSGVKWWRNTLRNALDGVLIVVLVLLPLALVTIKTYDSTPKVHYAGFIADAPPDKVLPLLRQIGGGYPIDRSRLVEYRRGLEEVARQKARNYRYAIANDSILALEVTDSQANKRGLEIANQLLNGGLFPFDVVILTGDMVQFSQPEEVKYEYSGWPAVYYEQGYTGPKVQVLMVGGNHEDSGPMATFKSLGYKMLSEQVVTIRGLSFFGMDDPLAYSYLLNEPSSEQLAESSKLLAQRWLQQDPRPQVIAVHNIDQAKDVINEANKAGMSLTVVFGHDHQTSVKTDGDITLIGGGTAGAGGYDQKARDPSTPYTYQIMEFSGSGEHELLSVTTVNYYDLTGRYTTDYQQID